MLGCVAAVSATESPSQLRPPFIQRMCRSFPPLPAGGTFTSVTVRSIVDVCDRRTRPSLELATGRRNRGSPERVTTRRAAVSSRQDVI
jgi:hypothetical protein